MFEALLLNTTTQRHNGTKKSGIAVLVRQPVTERAVGKAEFEVLDHFRIG